jgi:cytoskeletal protein RodZ
MTTEAIDQIARVRLEGLCEDIDRLEVSITRHRTIIHEIEKYLAEIKGPITWIMRLAGVIALGVLGVLGTLLWTAMTAHIR